MILLRHASSRANSLHIDVLVLITIALALHDLLFVMKDIVAIVIVLEGETRAWLNIFLVISNLVSRTLRWIENTLIRQSAETWLQIEPLVQQILLHGWVRPLQWMLPFPILMICYRPCMEGVLVVNFDTLLVPIITVINWTRSVKFMVVFILSFPARIHKDNIFLMELVSILILVSHLWPSRYKRLIVHIFLIVAG